MVQWSSWPSSARRQPGQDPLLVLHDHDQTDRGVGGGRSHRGRVVARDPRRQRRVERDGLGDLARSAGALTERLQEEAEIEVGAGVPGFHRQRPAIELHRALRIPGGLEDGQVVERGEVGGMGHEGGPVVPDGHGILAGPVGDDTEVVPRKFVGGVGLDHGEEVRHGECAVAGRLGTDAGRQVGVDGRCRRARRRRTRRGSRRSSRRRTRRPPPPLLVRGGDAPDPVAPVAPVAPVRTILTASASPGPVGPDIG